MSDFLQGQENQGLARMLLSDAAQGSPQIETEIAEKAAFPDRN
jgi:hypothetical protein